jgi:hypothetical protein
MCRARLRSDRRATHAMEPHGQDRQEHERNHGDSGIEPEVRILPDCRPSSDRGVAARACGRDSRQCHRTSHGSRGADDQSPRAPTLIVGTRPGAMRHLSSLGHGRHSRTRDAFVVPQVRAAPLPRPGRRRRAHRATSAAPLCPHPGRAAAPAQRLARRRHIEPFTRARPARARATKVASWPGTGGRTRGLTSVRWNTVRWSARGAPCCALAARPTGRRRSRLLR